MEQLPEDLLIRLCKNLSMHDIFSLGGTCKSLRRFVFSLSIFRHMHVRDPRTDDNDQYRVQRIMTLFPRAEKFKIEVNVEGQALPQSWDDDEVVASVAAEARAKGVQGLEVEERGGGRRGSLQLCYKKLTIRGEVSPKFFRVLNYCVQLEELHLRLSTVSVEVLSQIAHTLPGLRTLTLPESLIISDPFLVSELLTGCSLVFLQLRFSSLRDPHFWATVASRTPPDKLALLTSVNFSSYGSTVKEDADDDLTEVVMHFKGLRELSFKGTLNYECLKAIAPDPPLPVPPIDHLVLPWPQMDYTQQIERYIVRSHPLVEAQVQARNDHLLELIQKYHAETLSVLHLSCTEGVTSDGLVRLLSACHSLTGLSLYFYDAHILDELVTSAITSLSHLRTLWLGGMSTAVVGPLRIVHEGLVSLRMQDLSVHSVQLYCPGLRKLIPPVYVEDLANAYELYARSYPDRFIVRVAEGKKIQTVSVKPTHTIQQLIAIIQRSLNNPNVTSVIVDGKALAKHLKCEQCLKNGGIVKILS